MDSETQNISLTEKVGYSLGDTASNLIFQTVLFFITYFYTDVFGIAPATLVTMFLITRIWDAVNDPIMGAVADRTNTRWGKFRPYLLWVAIPFGLVGVAVFTTPDLSMTGKIIYAYVTYILLDFVYTAINVPYSALMGVMTSNARVRTILSQFRFAAAFLGALIIQYSVLRLVKILGKGNEPLGWQLTMVVLSILAIIMFFITFITTKERVQPPREQKSYLKGDLRDLFRNKPWLLIAGGTVFQLTYITIRNGSIIYYFKYFVGDQQLTLFGNTNMFSCDSMTSTFLIAGTLATILGIVLTGWFSKVFGKRNCYVGFLGVTGIFTAVFYFFAPEDIILMFAMQLLASFTFGPVSVLQWAMYTDTADYSEWKNNRRATAFLMAASLFALKLGVALGGALLAGLLAFHGYVQGGVEQTAGGVFGVKLVMSLYPAIPALIGAGIMLFYPLTNKMMVDIEEDLNDRRRKSGEQEPDKT
jgi:GPH family glycoside/pentoside/hexuronide:cation symporter